MKIYLIYSFIGFLLIFLAIFVYLKEISSTKNFANTSQFNKSWWGIQSIDTVKISRDLAREKKDDGSYLSEIDRVLNKISQTGATHVSIGTPYDDEFGTYLKNWIILSRKYKLKVWFRGNWSGWEGWFDYPQIDKREHINKTANFILNNPVLFEDGDIFSPCPECENGTIGDPRFNGDVDGFRSFIKDEYQTCVSSFETIGKNVDCGLISMNLDVAKIVMDKDTADFFKVITIDHYSSEPNRFKEDLEQLYKNTSSKIVLGEFGAPIPDIHGSMDQTQQSEWLDKAMHLISELKYIGGLNYWTAVNSTTSIWTDDGKEKKALAIIEKYFKPKTVYGIISDEFGQPLQNVEITTVNQFCQSDKQGRFRVTYLEDKQKILARFHMFEPVDVSVEELIKNGKIYMKRSGLINSNL